MWLFCVTKWKGTFTGVFFEVVYFIRFKLALKVNFYELEVKSQTVENKGP
jgi:hypothetical protein